ncbi:MAG: hypothetical protein P9L99_09235 [Candidatus Lernaella stagnicola]|nr:hypothetical protein [Candidatus Lernaella stagnicola]
MKTRYIVVLAVFVSLAFATLLWAESLEPPFSGCYQIKGELAKLRGGDKITLTEWVTPICSQCFLFHRELKNKPLGDDVEVKYEFVFHPDKGKPPVRLLLLTRLVKPELEKKMLETLFNAAFEQKVSVEDEEILGAIAASLGLGEAWADPSWQKKVDVEMKNLEAAYQKLGGPPKTPLLVINDALHMSPGICNVLGSEMPDKLHEVLDGLRAYRAK